jgi:RNA polymerase-binding protein DksA
MDKRTREKFKKMLLREREKITGEIMRLSEDTLSSSQRDSSGDLSGYSMHIADVGTDTFQRDFELGLVTREQEILYKIDEALQMVEDGTYGTCQSCRQPISESRLKAVPFAKLCISCQEKEERLRNP